MTIRTPRFGRAAGVAALGGIVLSLAACANDFDATRSASPRGTLGEEMYGVLCDRVGAQGLHDDMTGASFSGICHRDADGKFVDKVDDSRLPPLVDGAPSVDGKSISLQ